MGKKTSANKEGLYGLKGPKDNADPHLAEEQARNAGMLGFLKQSEGSHIASIFGRDTALGQDSSSVLGGLIGNQVGAAYGAGGLALWGTGTGGGGTGEGTIGALGGRRAAAPDVQQGEATVQGSLDKEIIRRIVRRHINEVRYCYQQELANFPGLQGRVVVRFTIGGNGDVIASVLQSSTVANGTLENCIVQTVHRWQFPYPHGGRIIISYPFVLTPGDGVTARDPIADALAILGGDGSIIERVERASARLGRRPISRAEVLAWTIQRRGPGFQTSLLVARLLRLARRDHDAVRVLSESAGAAPQPIAAELRAIGAPGDAAEVLRLAKR
jgi:TonB family protein